MALLSSTGRAKITNINSQRALTMYLDPNIPRTQVYDPDSGVYNPDWTKNNLVITPKLLLNQAVLPLNASGLSITYKRREGNGTEAALVSGESISGGILTVSANKLANVASQSVTYICYVTYLDTETQKTVNIQNEVTMNLLRNAQDARVVSVECDSQVFKYNKDRTLTGPQQISLSAVTQGVNITKWQYKKSDGTWSDYPSTSDNANITGATLIVKPGHAVFFNDTATVRVLTNDANITDAVTLSKLYDGATGATGAVGPGAISVMCDNEAEIFPASKDGLVTPAKTSIVKITAYQGTKIIPATLTLPAAPSGMTLKQATADNVITVTVEVANNAALGNAATLSGSLDFVISAAGEQITKVFSWAKSPRGATGAAGANAVLFEISTPDGALISNGEGSLTLEAVGRNGTTDITSGATYQWAKLVGGNYSNISGATAKTYEAQASSIDSLTTFRCAMVYGGKTYYGYVTLQDVTDDLRCEVIILDPIFKNGIGESSAYARLFLNGVEVDGLKATTIGTTAPANPSAGAFWYKVDKTAKTVTLMKYSGSAWAAATGADLHTAEYEWYRIKMDNTSMDTSAPFKTGKVIFISNVDATADINLDCEGIYEV